MELKLIGIIFALIGWVLFLGPYCISSEVTALVWGYIAASIIILVFVISKIVKTIIKQLKKESA